MALNAQISWRGLQLGTGTPYRLQKLTGWESRPPSRRRDEERANGHGVHLGPIYANARVVTAEGVLVDRDAARGLLAALEVATPFSSALEDLAVTVFGRTLTAGARVVDRDLPQELTYNVGLNTWALSWACPDPLRYGTAQVLTTGLPTSGGGLAYPLAYPLAYGALGDTGQVVLNNPGTAPAPILFGVRGPLPQGFELSGAGRRLRYPVAVPAGQVIALDTATGTVLVEGTASRRGNLTIADWLTVPARGTLAVQFTSLGGAYDPAAQLTATTAEAHW